MHVYVHGRLGADSATSMLEAAEASVANGLVMVVHLQSVRQMTAAGLGALMDVRRQLLEAGLSMSLAGLNFKLRFLLHAWCAQPLFDEWQPAIARGRSLAPQAEAPARIDLAVEQEVLQAQTRIRG
jgi:ABC-type transporter Mla MlaB component